MDGQGWPLQSPKAILHPPPTPPQDAVRAEIPSPSPRKNYRLSKAALAIPSLFVSVLGPSAGQSDLRGHLLGGLNIHRKDRASEGEDIIAHALSSLGGWYEDLCLIAMTIL